MLTEHVSRIAVAVLETTDYAGAGFLMALESMIVPLPSEAVMPFVGFMVADGKWDLSLAMLATSLGSLIGSLLSYAMGYWGGRPFVLSVGRFLFLNVEDLERAERFFHRRQGTATLFIARFVPVVRHLISIPAGVGKMPLLPFCLATVIGATLWNGFLLYCGIRLRESWPLVQKFTHHIDLGIAALVCLGGVWFLWDRARAARRRQLAAAAVPSAAPPVANRSSTP
jgi:membrane protein DedA with SNARE-associated domain